VLLLLAVATWQARHLPSVAGVLVVVVIGILIASVSWRLGSVSNLPADRTIVVVGDSLSAGVGASTDGTWPQLLSEQLKVRVSNLAQAGATLASGVLQARAVPEGSAIVLVELGGNDVLSGVGPERFEVELRSLLALLVTRDRRVLMFELPLLPSQYSYGRVQRNAAREYGVGLIPRRVLAGAVALPGHTSDGLHLSARGHAWLAARVAEAWDRDRRTTII
jgi:acyl-CoA thioesterase-1